VAAVEGVEPTNNGSERALRPAVLWRKGSFGCDSEAGSRFAERLLTAATMVGLAVLLSRRHWPVLRTPPS
jgi:hypothetical protein